MKKNSITLNPNRRKDNKAMSNTGETKELINNLKNEASNLLDMMVDKIPSHYNDDRSKRIVECIIEATILELGLLKKE